MIKKLLIANRGEIACRIIRSARAMGVRTVAIYSDADAKANHVALADEAVALGGNEPSESYLNIAKVVDAGVSTGCDAVHPGYGFLSERAEFVDAMTAAGITFVGPSSAAMNALGSKIAAKSIAVKAGAPVVPGYFEPGATMEDLRSAAEKIGYPVLLKASAGGGGRGMRVVRDPELFEEEFQIATDEALKGFGDGAMMVEKLIERPRHLEVQILADQHGNVACLFERECSLQRRHQKLVEEAPSGVGAVRGDLALWPAMQKACRDLIIAAGYVGAGTVEFIVDEKAENFYFLEVNARLQVEHPVTEMITGLDLVAWQLRIAQGERLDLSPGLMTGDRSAIHGHSIEVRIVSEDPERGFMPSTGPILSWVEPTMTGLRIDTGFGAKSEVSRYYDSLLAKVIAHGETREVARRKLVAALRDFHILGVKTNLAFLIDLLEDPNFATANFDTGTIGRDYAEWSPGPIPGELGLIAAAAEPAMSAGGAAQAGAYRGAWDIADGFRNARG
jgi:acetyl/propionyl-CoA carboxylase alpha subunit